MLFWLVDDFENFAIEFCYMLFMVMMMMMVLINKSIIPQYWLIDLIRKMKSFSLCFLPHSNQEKIIFQRRQCPFPKKLLFSLLVFWLHILICLSNKDIIRNHYHRWMNLKKKNVNDFTLSNQSVKQTYILYYRCLYKSNVCLFCFSSWLSFHFIKYFFP